MGNSEKLNKIFESLNRNEQFGLSFGLFPARLRKYNLDNEEVAEEAILNSLFKAQAMEGRDGNRAEAFPLDKLKKMMKEGQKR